MRRRGRAALWVDLIGGSISTGSSFVTSITHRLTATVSATASIVATFVGPIRLGLAVGNGGVDDDAHRLSDQLRALDKRSRRPGRRDELLGHEAA